MTLLLPAAHRSTDLVWPAACFSAVQVIIIEIVILISTFLQLQMWTAAPLSKWASKVKILQSTSPRCKSASCCCAATPPWWQYEDLWVLVLRVLLLNQFILLSTSGTHLHVWFIFQQEPPLSLSVCVVTENSRLEAIRFHRHTRDLFLSQSRSSFDTNILLSGSDERWLRFICRLSAPQLQTANIP